LFIKIIVKTLRNKTQNEKIRYATIIDFFKPNCWICAKLSCKYTANV